MIFPWNCGRKSLDRLERASNAKLAISQGHSDRPATAIDRLTYSEVVRGVWVLTPRSPRKTPSPTTAASLRLLHLRQISKSQREHR